jgi:hypothetical protein
VLTREKVNGQFRKQQLSACRAAAPALNRKLTLVPHNVAVLRSRCPVRQVV